MKYTIFYSWQSDTDSKFNWTLIRDCINSAIKNIENKGQLKGILFNDLQESTSNIPGSPDTVQTIEERINNCHIFIGDLTITNSHPKILEFLKDNIDVPYKFSPNSNVYGEYNWAFSKHGSTAIIAVMNTFYGDPNKNSQILPFDIRQKRFPFSYSCGAEEEIKKASSNLTGFFETAIRESILKIIEEERFRYLPFITFAEHKNEFLQKCEYCSNKTLEDFKKNILGDNKNIRILGISGIGKTRLIIESIKESDELKARYLYCDCFENDDFAKIQEKLELILKQKDNSIIVLDNCDYQKAQRIILLKRRYLSSSSRVITIWNQDDKNISDDYAYINFNVDLHDVVDEIIDKKSKNISEENRKLINEFSDGIPLMAILLTESLNEGKTDVGKLSNKDFVNKLIFGENDEREILKSCSLFRYIGYDGDYRRQIKFIVENNSITPISGDSDLKMALFDRLFYKYKKREIIETNGRLFGIRPRPLAFALAEEWFDDCSLQRMETFIKLIQDEKNPDNKILTESLCSQIKYLGNNEKVKLLIVKLTDCNGPFDNAEVVNTELGSRLFRSFVEVNPVAVANNLYRLFGKMSIEQLKNVEDGRRNLVWTLEKLCFDKDTFDKGAKLMMSFAVAENETWGNNATNEFLHLFKIRLAGTQANFDERLEIIKWGLKKESEFILMSLKALSSALESQHFTRFFGAETQGTKILRDYEPTTNSEILKYWSEVLDILTTFIVNETEYSDFCLEVIANKTRGLIRAGIADILIPVIKKIAERIGNDWDLMLDRLYNVKEYDFQRIKPELRDEINKLIEQLTKKDFYSRFALVGKHGDSLKIDFKESERIRQSKYLELANEFVGKEFCSKNILQSIYSNKNIFCYPFGIRIAELIEGDKHKLNEFVEISIELLSVIDFDNRNSSILIDFCRGVRQEETKNLIIDSLLQKNELIYLLFPIFGVFRKGFDQLNILFSLVEKDVDLVQEFHQYFRYYSLSEYSEIELQELCEKIKGYGTLGEMTALSMLHDKLFFDKKVEPDSILYPLLEELLKSIEININLLNNHDYFQMVETILTRTKSPSFARFMNQQVIKLAKDPAVSFSFNYNLKNLYSILIANYFDEIWLDLSKALLADKEDYFVFYNFKNLLGSHISDTHNEIGILFSGNMEKILDWCKDNPLEAPARLALMVPIFEKDGIHPFAKRLIDEFGDKLYVLENLAANMGTFSWVGSTIPLLKSKRKIYESLVDHPCNIVGEWAKRYINYTDQEILRETQREEEQKILYG